MKIKELLYKTPEMTEEKLLEIINNELSTLKRINRHLINRINQIYKYYSNPIGELILKEFDVIQEGKSYLTKSERDTIIGFVGACMIKMTKENDRTEDGGLEGTNSESSDNDRLVSIPEIEEIRDSSEG